MCKIVGKFSWRPLLDVYDELHRPKQGFCYFFAVAQNETEHAHKNAGTKHDFKRRARGAREGERGGWGGIEHKCLPTPVSPQLRGPCVVAYT